MKSIQPLYLIERPKFQLLLVIFQGGQGTLVYGFSHAAFAFGYEAAGVNKSTIDGNQVPPGALVKFVQKGIQYLELETDLSNECKMIATWMKTSSAYNLWISLQRMWMSCKKMIEEKKEKLQKDKPRRKDKANADHEREEKGRRRNNRRKNSENGIEEGVKRTRTKKTNEKEKPLR
ncbi:hypothetical protein CQW23_28801 [Capsicum baccatum]|uniref:Uncharacterized protein n=1 Tax=Capsicum baccatum TaxID=33114 RepID=A0A2G2VHK4_CAPBA|nr:hypothetical protein CQW23_28801 [Capsicum baccatum]